MVRVVELTHFTKDKRPRKLTVDEFEPSMNDKGYPKDGSYIIAIEDNEGRKAFALNEAEASLLCLRLFNILLSHSNDYMNLWGMVREKHRNQGGEEK